MAKKDFDSSFSEVFDPDLMPLETLVYNKALMAQHYRIERLSSDCLIGRPNEMREKLNGLWGAILTMVMNIYDNSKDEYVKLADKFMRLDVNEYADDALIDFFRVIMLMHKRNIKEYRRLGLLPSKGVTMYDSSVTEEEFDALSEKAEEIE